MHPRAQGDVGEASAIEWLTFAGAIVCKPLGHSPNFDLIAEMAGRVLRIEVKTTIRLTPIGNWQAMLCTRGGNQSWSGETKRFDPRACDYVFIHVGDGRRWFIPSARIEVATAIVVGGQKYSEFEVERGRPLLDRTLEQGATTIAVP